MKDRDGIKGIQRTAYAVSHFGNDLCASMWFTYGLYYIHYVQGLSDSQTGLVILCGQFADGIATTIVGVFSDKTNTRIGRRMPWYIFGTIIVYPCFLGIFYDCFACKMFEDDDHVTGTIYFCILAATFNVGWAAV